MYTLKVDNNVQVQGLPGRMTGYWRNIFEETNHKTSPYRTSIKAIEQYENIYIDPFGLNIYKTNGFQKNNNGKLILTSSMLAVENIQGLNSINLSKLNNFKRRYKVFKTQQENDQYAKNHGARNNIKYKSNHLGFKLCATTSNSKVQLFDDVINLVNTSNIGSNMPKSISKLKINEYMCRRYVCYKDKNNIESEYYIKVWVKRLE